MVLRRQAGVGIEDVADSLQFGLLLLIGELFVSPDTDEWDDLVAVMDGRAIGGDNIGGPFVQEHRAVGQLRGQRASLILSRS